MQIQLEIQIPPDSLCVSVCVCVCEAKIILMSKFLITQPLAEFEFVFKICPKLNKAGRGHSPFVYICVRVCVCVCVRE